MIYDDKLQLYGTQKSRTHSEENAEKGSDEEKSNRTRYFHQLQQRYDIQPTTAKIRTIV